MSYSKSFYVADAVSVSSNTTKTVLQVYNDNTPARYGLTQLHIGAKSTGNAVGMIQVRILQQTTAGTMTGITEVTWDNDTSMKNALIVGTKNASSEPTAGDVLHEFNFHPKVGYHAEWGAWSDTAIIVDGAKRLGVELTNPLVNPDLTFNVTMFMES